jgi:hypothetical protein
MRKSRKKNSLGFISAFLAPFCGKISYAVIRVYMSIRAKMLLIS